MVYIGKNEFEHRLIQLCLKSGKQGLPRRQRDKHILLKSITLLFDLTRFYSESEINNVLRLWLAGVAIRLETDHDILRAELVGAGYLDRDTAGFVYTLGKPCDVEACFEKTVEDINVLWIVVEATHAMAKKRRAHYPRPDEDAGKRIIRARLIAAMLVGGVIGIEAACEELSDLYDPGHFFLRNLAYFKRIHMELENPLPEFPPFGQNEMTLEGEAFKFLQINSDWAQAANGSGLPPVGHDG